MTNLSLIRKQKINMSNWERKEADNLADAIGKHIRSNPDLAEANELLAEIRLAVATASQRVDTNAEELNRYRSTVCKICRDASLYECDVEERWSVNCTFVFANTTQFGDL